LGLTKIDQSIVMGRVDPQVLSGRVVTRFLGKLVGVVGPDCMV